MEQMPVPVSCEEANLLAFTRLGTPVIIGGPNRPHAVTPHESKIAQALAKGANCEGCIGCSLQSPGRMEPLTEAYNKAVRTGTLQEQKELLVARLPEDRVISVDEPAVPETQHTEAA